MMARIALAGALCVAVSVLLLAYLYQREERTLASAMPLESPTEFRIAPGASMTDVASQLAARGWVRSPRFLAWHARLAGKAGAIKAGTYRLLPGMSAFAAVDLFVSGRELQYAFTIVEGWTVTDLLAALAGSDVVERTLGDIDGATLMARLGRPQRHPEGMFFADTYHFPPGTTDIELLRRAMQTLDERLARVWEGRLAELPLKTPYEALILASIVEKETAVAEERPLIAGVFVQRLRRGMRLETDPTVIYGLGDAFDGNLRRRDLVRDTEYNTYTRHGLPPTPIALVGAQALEAAVRPVVNGALFFVARGDGRHHFSQTYAEHLKAVRRYQIERRPAQGG